MGVGHFLFCFSVYNLILLAKACSDPSNSHKVRIVADYTPPTSYNLKPTSYLAGSTLTLSCEVEGVKNGYHNHYEWRSTCQGNCFTRGRNTKTVSIRYLRSYDAGVHTCVVYDYQGCTQSASININVTGAAIFVDYPINRVLPNNGLIVESGYFIKRIPLFRGLSASSRSNVGQLINPQGRDITASSTDPFIVSSFEPGTMTVRCFRSLLTSEVGIYTYRTPDETGKIVDVNFGLYTSNSSQAPYVSELVATIGSTPPFVLNCSSLYSPPTQVIWKRNGHKINVSADGYKMSQFLVDRVSSSYVSTLSKDGVLDDVVGEYSCTVTNTLGTSNTRNVSMEPISITGHEKPIIAFQHRAINCSTVLNASKLEWRIVGIGTGESIDEPYEGQSLVLSLTPQGTQLDGTKITCRVTTTSQEVFEKTVTIVVKELENLVQIEGSSEAIPVGTYASFLCVAKTDFLPTLQWLDQDNNLVTSSGTSVRTEHQYSTGRSTYMRLVFKPMRSSHKGPYTCKSTIRDPSSVNSTTKKINVKLSSKLVAMEESSDEQHYIGEPLTLTCWTYLDDSIDTAVTVSHSWVTRNGSTITTDASRSVSEVSLSDEGYSSTLTFSPLSRFDSGIYTCQSTVQPSSSEHETGGCISSSTPQSASIVINPELKVDIRIDYSSPDPQYSPPDYRAASSVKLTCMVTGTLGYTYYRWSSTCRNCFASRSSRSVLSKTFLVAADEGVHTCTVTDRSGNSGRASITMNIVGVGIYVSNSKGTGSGSSVGAQANNSYAIVDSYSSRLTTRFSMYCCSSSRYSYGAMIYPNGIRRTSGGYTSYDSITRYSSSHSYAGCIQFKYFGVSRYSQYSWYYRYRDFNFYFSYPGIYTCSFGDTYSSIGLYSRGTRVPEASLISIQKSLWSSTNPNSLKLTATIRYSPPADITWYRDDTPINAPENVTDSNILITTYVANRWTSYYDVALEVKDSPDNLVGDYSLALSNETESDNETYVSVTGIQISCNSARFIIGQSVTCTCSSDLRPTLIEWFLTGQSTSACSQKFLTNSWSDYGSSELVFTPTTDDHGKMLECVTSTPYGKQNTSMEVQVEVPSSWGAVSIASSLSSSPVHSQNFTLTCSVISLPGIHLPVSVQWLFQNGSVLATQGNRTIGSVELANHTVSMLSSSCLSSHTYSRSSLSLSFHPVANSDGGAYKCQAKISVPWTRLQPSIGNSSVITVTTQAKFQLKIYPVTHCSTWSVQTGRELENSIKKNIEEAVSDLCHCPFRSTAIHSGEFNCLPKSCDSDDNCGSSTTTLGPVVYRAAVNGTSDLLTADQILNYIDMWREESGTLLHKDMIRLGIQGKKKCALKIDSFKSSRC